MGLRLAIVGYGVVGPLHAMALRMLPTAFGMGHQEADLVLVVDADPRARERAEAELGLPAISPHDHFIEQYGINAIDCCTPTESHFSTCSLALAKGAAVFCEKPVTGSALASRDLFTLAEQTRLPFGVNFNFRFVPALQKARECVEGGDLGDLRSVRVEYHRSSNLGRWRSGMWEGPRPHRSVLLDLGPHAIDMVHYLFGPIRLVSAQARSGASEATNLSQDDHAKLELQLAGGALGTVEVSKVTPGAANDLSVFAYGTKGTLRFSMENTNLLDIFRHDHGWQRHERLRIYSDGAPSTGGAIPTETPTSVLAWHASSIAAFVRAVIDGTTPSPSIADGLNVDLVLDAARRSLVTSSAWVAVTGT